MKATLLMLMAVVVVGCKTKEPERTWSPDIDKMIKQGSFRRGNDEQGRVLGPLGKPLPPPVRVEPGSFGREDGSEGGKP